MNMPFGVGLMVRHDRDARSLTGKKRLTDISWYITLGKLLGNIKKSSLTDDLSEALQSVTTFDYTVTFAYNGTELPICLHHTFPTQSSYKIHVENYQSGSYLLDPFYRSAIGGLQSGLYRLSELAPDHFYKSEYYRSYYIRTGPVDEIAFFVPGNEGWTIVTSLMRTPTRPAFSVHELKVLRCVEPLIRGITELHWRADERLKGTTSVQNEAEALRRAVRDALNQKRMPPLTPRELDVVTLVLEGHSSESIATLLGISAGTVRIHRKNVYTKMRISSQRELFSVFMHQQVYQ